MLIKTLCLTVLSAFVLSGAYAEDQVSEDQPLIVSETQVPSEESQIADNEENNDVDLIGRCPCRDKKDNPTPPEGTTLSCGCDEENNDALANVDTEEDATVAHHGEEGEHDLADDVSENNGLEALMA